MSSVSNIPINTLLDSELERKFIEALSTITSPVGEKAKVSKELVNEKPGYRLVVGDIEWEVEPQVDMGPELGVAVRQRPDFVLHPITKRDEERNWLPVAVYTDGFEYHRVIVAEDTLKRAALRASGNFRVWSLSWNDVEGAFDHQGQGYMLNCLKIPELPREDAYSAALSSLPAGDFMPYKLSPFEKLAWYLTRRDAEKCFEAQAQAYGVGMLAMVADKDTFEMFANEIADVSDALSGDRAVFEYGSSLVNAWSPSEAEHLTILAAATFERMRTEASPDVVYAVIDDGEHSDASFKREWNGFLDLCNVMQFFDGFEASARSGLESGLYEELHAKGDGAALKITVDTSNWMDVIVELFDDESVDFATKLADLGLPAPDVVGFELETGEMAEMAWEGKRVCYLMAEQMADAAAFEAMSWEVIGGDTSDEKLEMLLGE